MPARSPDPAFGRMAERSLHAALKAWYRREGDVEEQPVEGYLVDLVRGDLLIEIQTRNFGGIRRKLAALSAAHAVRVIHPVAATRWIVKLDAKGAEGKRRRSPRKGSLLSLFDELVHVAEVAASPNLSFEVLLTEEEELRRPLRRNRKGWTSFDRRLVRVVDRRVFASRGDWRGVLPEGLPETWTTSELAGGLAIPRFLAQRIAYCLRRMGIIEAVGKRGGALLYRTAPEEEGASPGAAGGE